jgi:hypothetical protein
LSGWKEWGIGEVVEQSEFQSFVQNQVVQRFPDAAARDAALLGKLEEGMAAYLNDTNQMSIYNGVSWAPLSQQSSHNYIINGAFDVWQRGTSFGTALATNTFTADRWNTDVAGASGTLNEEISLQAFTPNDLEAIGFGEATNYLRWTTTDSGSRTRRDVRQKIENVRNLAGQTVTLSYYAKADAARTITTRIRQEFNSSTGISISTTQALTTSWQRYTQTVTLGDLSGKTLGATNWLAVVFEMPSGASTIDIWGVQLEAGSVATPFKRHAPSLQGELAACQRYYQRFVQEQNFSSAVGFCESDTSFRVYHPLSVPLRGSPSVAFTGAVSARGNGSTFASITFGTVNYIEGLPGIRMSFTGTSLPTNHVLALRHNGAVEFNSEL